MSNTKRIMLNIIIIIYLMFMDVKYEIIMTRPCNITKCYYFFYIKNYENMKQINIIYSK